MPPTGEVQRLAHLLTARIVGGSYPAGLRLPPEVDLAAELGSSRSTLREALRHLADMGLVKSRRGSGVMVLDFRREGTFALLPAYLAAGRFDHPLPVLAGELLRMRRMLAVEAARLAAAYAAPGALVTAKQKMKELDDLVESPREHALVELDLFRELLFSSGVWPAVWLANGFWEPVREIHRELAGAIDYIPAGHGAMLRTLFALIERKEAGRAAELVDAHFERVDRALMPRIEKLLKPVPEKKRAK